MVRKTYSIDNIDSGLHVHVARIDTNPEGNGVTDS